jgi:hypothetical protein
MVCSFMDSQSAHQLKHTTHLLSRTIATSAARVFLPYALGGPSASPDQLPLAGQHMIWICDRILATALSNHSCQARLIGVAAGIKA